MPCYSFSIQDADGSDREYVGRMALRDDDEARAFGIAIIWDMRDAATLYEGCTMHVADGKRRVSTFSLNAADRASASRLPSADAPFSGTKWRPNRMPIQRPSVQGRKSQTTKFVNDIKTKK